MSRGGGFTSGSCRRSGDREKAAPSRLGMPTQDETVGVLSDHRLFDEVEVVQVIAADWIDADRSRMDAKARYGG